MTRLGDAYKQIQTVAAGISGVKSAPQDVSELDGGFPFIVTYPRTGEFKLHSAGVQNDLHAAYTELHVSRALLGAGIDQAVEIAEAFADALWADPKLGGKVQSLNKISYEFGGLSWAGIDTIGFRFTVEFKI
jgi:hypothetical protein